MQARISAQQLTLDVPAFLQRERPASGWAGMFLSAAFEPPKRQLLRLLDRIDLDIRDGDRVAILGRNGAGKSTLLRVLNRVYQPTSGTIEVRGSCQALLNMSLGFNGEATVRENVYLRGVAMDLHSSFLRRHMDEILEFAGLQEKAGHRLRTLSSGQRLRLGFAISTSVQHDIILMDEWVGTGDANFMARATERMQNRVSGSRIVVLASHSVGLLRDVCNKGVVLEAGRLVFAGEITESLGMYHELLAKIRDNQPIELDEPESGPVQVLGAIEEIQLTADGGRLLVRGWMLDSHGRVPEGLALEINGYRYSAGIEERIRRPDVQRHFGVRDDACGFRAVVDLPQTISADELAGARVLGGNTAQSANAQLRLAPSVQALLDARQS